MLLNVDYSTSADFDIYIALVSGVPLGTAVNASMCVLVATFVLQSKHCSMLSYPTSQKLGPDF